MFKFPLGLEWNCPFHGDHARIVSRTETIDRGIKYYVDWNHGDDGGEYSEGTIERWLEQATKEAL